MSARDRFVATRKAVIELDNIHALIMSEGDDWKPPGVHVKGIADPTASRAIRNVDEWQDQLAELRRREEELTSYIGTTLAVIEGVRNGFGEIYATLLEHRYIDVWTWAQIYDEYGIKRQYGHYLINIAFDWIDSVGVSRILNEDLEL